MLTVPPQDTPTIGRLNVPTAWPFVDLISDLHLQASEPRTLAAWHHFMRTTDAPAVLILGDLFEVWVGDDAVAEDPFLQSCADILRQTAQRTTVCFMPGNRDFLVGPHFLSTCGVKTLSDPTVLEWGTLRVLLSHGDALCLGDQAYQQFRQQVRSPNWQRDFLAQPLAQRLAFARALRAQSEAQKQGQTVYADADTPSCLQWLSAAGSHQLIHGHTHRPADHLGLGNMNASRHVLSDWSLDHWPMRAQVLRLSRDGHTHRIDWPPSDARA